MYSHSPDSRISRTVLGTIGISTTFSVYTVCNDTPEIPCYYETSRDKMWISSSTYSNINFVYIGWWNVKAGTTRKFSSLISFHGESPFVKIARVLCTRWREYTLRITTVAPRQAEASRSKSSSTVQEGLYRYVKELIRFARSSFR